MSFFSFCSGKIELGRKTYIMGIVNVTPDSFSDGGKFFSPENAVSHALKLIDEGVDIIDLGACSTKPFSEPVSSEEEISRLIPVIKELRKRTDVPVSIDTFYPETAEIMLSEGADIINDVGGVFNTETAELIKNSGAGYIVMHGGVKKAPAQCEKEYPLGVVNDVQLFFDEMQEKLISFGINKEQLCFDAGFGFMKNTAQNALLLKNLSLLSTDGCALLTGLSRKRFIGELSENTDASDRLAGTLAANILAVSGKTDIIRTHEVKLHKEALKLVDSVLR